MKRTDRMQQSKLQYMLKGILSGLLLLPVIIGTAQVRTQIIGDSIHLHGNTGTTELILENSTKNVNGFLYNKGNGRTEFRQASDNTVQTLTDGSTITWNAASGVNASLSLGGTGRTLTISNPIVGQTYHIKIAQNGTGKTISTWPSGTLWVNGIPPTLSTVSGSVDLVTFYYDGTNYFGDYKLLYKAVTSNVYVYAVDSKSNVSATIHSLSNVPAGALLVLSASAGSSQSNDSIISSPSLTWTKRADASASVSGDAEIWTAVFTAGGNITVTSNWLNQPQSSTCYVIMNQESTLGGASATNNAQSAPSVGITTTRANSLIIAVTSDWNAKNGSKAYRLTPVETNYSFYPGGATFYHYYQQATTATSYTMGLSTPTGQSGGTALYEIRGN
jgi:hypothetical protein